MLVQVLIQNACSDLAQLGLAFDRVDERAAPPAHLRPA